MATRNFFGIHSVTPYNRDTYVPYGGSLKVLENSSLSLAGETIDLLGGSSKYPWASEDGSITAEMSLSFSEFPDFVFELFLGNAPTTNAAEATGAVSTITNKNGTSVVSATVGIASVAATSADEADLKFGTYVAYAKTATDITLYLLSDVDKGRGTNATLTASMVVADDITIPNTGGTIADAALGLEFTGGSGTVGMTIGDTAYFDVRPINSESMTVTIGASSDQIFPEFGAIVMGQKRGNQEMLEIDIFRCKSAGMPLNFQRNAWSAAEVNIKVLYDEDLDGIFDMTFVKPT